MSYARQPNAPDYWTYSGLPIQADVESHQLAVHICKQHLRKNKRVLDLAAGHGALSKSLIDSGIHVSCTSWNGNVDLPVPTYQIDLDKPFRVADVGGQRFRLACALEIIEHVENPAQLLRSLAEVIEEGGHLLLSTPNIESAQARVEWMLNGYPYTFSSKEFYENRHMAMMWRQGVEGLLSLAGFDVVERHFVGEFRFSSRLQRTLRTPLHWMIRKVCRGDTAGASRMYLAVRTQRAPKILGAEEVA